MFCLFAGRAAAAACRHQDLLILNASARIKMGRRSVSASILTLLALCLVFLVPSYHGRPAARALHKQHTRALDKRFIWGGNSGGLLGGLSGVFSGLTDTVHNVTDGLVDTVEDLTETLEEKIEKAVKLIDVDLLRIDLSQLAKNLLNTVHNITITPMEFLKKYGYLVDPEDDGFILRDIIKALLAFQKMYHVSLTGILDLETLKAMLKPRCGMPDILTQTLEGLDGILGTVSDLIPISKRGIVKRYNVPGYKWSKRNLSWKIHNFYESSEISPTVQRRAILNALNYWQEASGLTFTETAGEADLNIHFVWADHGDGSQNAFDGPGGVLAHAFFPQSGEAHFDYSERWTDEKDAGINLKIVAAHEFGHAFGLGHSEVRGALMAPYYQGFEANYKLPADDIQGIQQLYGSRDGLVGPAVTDAPTTTTTERSIVPAGSAPDTCSVRFRAVTQTHDDRIYVYNGRWMWRMSEYGLDEDFPVTIDTYYEHPPEDIEAALFTRKNYYTYFFKGREVWVYYGFQLIDKETITTPGYPSSIQAAIELPDETICLIQGSSCFIFDEDRLDIVSSTPRKLKDVFPGAPYLFDSAVRVRGETDIFFFYSNYYYRYSEANRAVLSGYPKEKSGPWMGPACNAPPYTPK